MGIYRNDDEPESDDRIAERVEELEAEIAADRARVIALDVEQSELLDGEQYEAIFTALADLDGKEPADLLGSDLLATLYRLAKPLAAMREQAITEAAQDQAERESSDWPTWRGSMAATRHRAQIEGARLVAWEAQS